MFLYQIKGWLLEYQGSWEVVIVVFLSLLFTNILPRKMPESNHDVLWPMKRNYSPWSLSWTILQLGNHLHGDLKDTPLWA